MDWWELTNLLYLFAAAILCAIGLGAVLMGLTIEDKKEPGDPPTSSEDASGGPS